MKLVVTGANGRVGGLRNVVMRRLFGKIGFLIVKESSYIPELYAGTETSTDGLCRVLTRMSHQVAVAATSKVVSPRLQDDGARVDDFDRIEYTLGYPVFLSSSFARAVEGAVGKMKPDVVIYQEPSHEGWNRIEDYLECVPVFFYSHSIYSELREFYSNFAIKNRDGVAILCNSQVTRDFISESGIRTVVVPPLFGIERYRGGNSNGNRILMVSVQYEKGVDIALKIAAARPNHVFVFVESWSKSEEEIAAYRRMMGELRNVHLLPSRPNLTDVYASTKLLLMPSRYSEGWGRVVTEAQLFGIPVLGSNRGNLINTIGPGGVTLDPDEDIGLWLNAFDRILDDSQYFAELSHAAKKHSERILQEVGSGADRIVELARSTKRCSKAG